MASTHKHIRSSTANKRPTTAIADGQIALNTNSTSPGLFFKDSTGATIIKIGPVHIGATAPNATPPSGGSSGNSTGEIWLDTSLTPNGVKIWDGSAWVNVTPIGSTTVQGLLELATNAETQTGSDTARAVTPASLQSKLSDSTSTTSSTTIASSTAVKSAYDLAAAALPKTGGTVTGNLEIGTTGSLTFEGATADNFETTIAVTDPTADRTITLPDTTGTVVTTGDSGTVTSTMIANDTIVNADINASAAIVGTKISPDFGSQNTTTTGTNTAASFIPTSSTAPTNGVYLAASNSVAISTNGTEKLRISSLGEIGLGGANYGTSGQVLTSNGSGSAPTWQSTAASGTSISVGDTNATVSDTGSNGVFTVTCDGSERFRVSNTTNALLGISSTFNIYSSQSSGLLTPASSFITASTSASGTGGTTYLTKFGNHSSGAGLTFYKSRNASIGSNTAVTSGDNLGTIDWSAATGANSHCAASVKVEADSTVSNASLPGRLVISTSASGSGQPTERIRIDSNGFSSFTGSVGRGAPVTKTGNFTVGATENWLICNGTGTITVTLPTASAWTGREVMIKTIAAFTVISASSNVVPLVGGAAGTAILAATAGKYATLVSDGSNWIIMQAN